MPDHSTSSTQSGTPGYSAPQGPGQTMQALRTPRSDAVLRSHIEKAQNPRGALIRLALYLRPHSVVLSGIALLVILATLLDLAGPYLLGIAIDRFIRKGNVAGLMRISSLMLAVFVASWAAQFIQNYLMVTVAQKALRTIRSDLFARLQGLSLSFFDQRPQGELMSRLTNDIDAINAAVSHNMTDLIASLLRIVGTLIAMLSLNIWLALGELTILPFVLLVTGVIAQRTRQSFRQVQASLGRLNAITEENISGERVVQAFRRQRSAIADFQGANIAVRDASIRAQSLAMLMPPLLMILGEADIALMAGLGGWLALRNLATVGTIATFIVYARRFFQPLNSLANIYNSIQAALAGAERIFEVLDQEP